jgi:hypothetical protein
MQYACMIGSISGHTHTCNTQYASGLGSRFGWHTHNRAHIHTHAPTYRHTHMRSPIRIRTPHAPGGATYTPHTHSVRFLDGSVHTNITHMMFGSRSVRTQRPPADTHIAHAHKCRASTPTNDGGVVHTHTHTPHMSASTHIHTRAHAPIRCDIHTAQHHTKTKQNKVAAHPNIPKHTRSHPTTSTHIHTRTHAPIRCDTHTAQTQNVNFYWMHIHMHAQHTHNTRSHNTHTASTKTYIHTRSHITHARMHK